MDYQKLVYQFDTLLECHESFKIAVCVPSWVREVAVLMLYALGREVSKRNCRTS